MFPVRHRWISCQTALCSGLAFARALRVMEKAWLDRSRLNRPMSAIARIDAAAVTSAAPASYAVMWTSCHSDGHQAGRRPTRISAR